MAVMPQFPKLTPGGATLTSQALDLSFQFSYAFLSSQAAPAFRVPLVVCLVECSQVTLHDRVEPAELAVFPAQVQAQGRTVTPIAQFVYPGDPDGLVLALY